MASEVTLGELIARVYERGSWTREQSRYTPGSITREIGLSSMDLQDQMLKAGLTHLFVEDAPVITTSNGTSTYVVTGGYYQVLSVRFTPSTGRSIPLTSFMEGERADLLDTTVPRTGYPTHYMLTGYGSIELLPTPAGAYTVNIRRIPPQPPLVADEDTLDGLNGFEEWIVCDVVRKLAASEKDTTLVSLMDATCARQEARIATMARMRDRASNKRVVDVRGRSRRRYV
jgi:hypothetical protein